MATTNFAFTGFTQALTVTTSGEYNIQLLAGSGGSTQSAAGGNGAEVGAIVNLSAGEQLEIVVGGQGANARNTDGAGGGGGTFILANTGPNGTFVPLLVAGGGGGGGFVSPGVDGNGGDGQASAGTTPGAGGAGGGKLGGGGGAGDATEGADGGTSGGSGGGMFAGGASSSGNVGTGGFGGGGGGGANGGGGGGGDSGGQGGQGGQGSNSTLPTGGLGGNSLVTAGEIVVASETAPGANSGNGSASLKLANPTLTITSAPTTGPDNSVFTVTGTAVYGTVIPLAAGTTVSLSDNGQAVGSATTTADGTFSASVALPFAGANHVVATVVDPNGVMGTSADSTYSLFKAVRDLDGTSQEVERLYYTLLDRASDATALAHDDKALAHHKTNLNKIASALIHSHEYRRLHGHQSNSQFVDALFEGALGRPVDAVSLASDLHQFAHGLSHQALANSIAQSPEAVLHLGVKPA